MVSTKSSNAVLQWSKTSKLNPGYFTDSVELPLEDPDLHLLGRAGKVVVVQAYLAPCSKETKDLLYQRSVTICSKRPI